MSKWNKSSKSVDNKHEMSRRDKEDLLKKLILNSGLPLEIEISTFLAEQAKLLEPRELDIDISSHAYYVDKDEGKGRELDIKVDIPIISESDTEGILPIIFLNLLIQCKSIPGNAWVFFKSPYSVIPNCNATSILDAVGWIPRSHLGFAWQKNLHFHKVPITNTYDEYVLNQKASNKRHDNLFGAVISLAKATSYEIETQSKEFKKLLKTFSSDDILPDYVTIYHPILVFNGEMYLVEDIEKGKNMKLAPINHVGLSLDYTSGSYDIELFIDIVHKTEFENFLSQIVNDIKVLRGALGDEVGIVYRKEVSKALKWYLNKQKILTG